MVEVLVLCGVDTGCFADDDDVLVFTVGVSLCEILALLVIPTVVEYTLDMFGMVEISGVVDLLGLSDGWVVFRG